jgi:hypothetical protein
MRLILIVLMLVASVAAATAQQPTARDGAPSGKSARPSRQPEVPSGQATGETAKRQAIARLIARSQKYGGETLVGRRTYSGAQTSGPEIRKIVREMEFWCVKTRIKNLDIFGEREHGFQLAFSQLPDGRTHLGGGLNDYPVCKGPYRPFPELEAYNR